MSLATEAELQKYKDAGFNYLFIDWVFQENALYYPFENSKIKKVMDIADKLGLKCVVFQQNINGLTLRTESLINTDKADGVNYFASQEALDNYVAQMLKGLKDHPAFDGVIFDDEPSYNQFTAMAEVYASINRVAPDTFVMVNLLPFADSSERLSDGLFCKAGDYEDVKEAYAYYLNEYYTKLGKDLGYLMYDDYPLLNGNNYPSTNAYVLPSYLYANQVISNFCRDNNLRRITVYQSCEYSNRRPVDGDDMSWQMNIGMAFGNKNYAYYTYYPLINANPANGERPTDDAFVDYTGTPTDRYYAFQSISQEMQFNAKALMNFDYVGMQYLTKGNLPADSYDKGLVNDAFTNSVTFDFTVTGTTGGMVLVTELYDEANDRYGYYVVNITDPYYQSEVSVELNFDGFDYVQIYQSEKITNFVNSGSVNITLGTGCGAFVIPFN